MTIRELRSGITQTSDILGIILAGLCTIIGSGGGPSGGDSDAPPTLESITVTPENPSIPLGTSQLFQAIGGYSDSSAHDISASVTWASSNLAVATLSVAGLATSVNEGATTITATSGALQASTTLTVGPPPSAPLVSIVVTPNNPGIAKGLSRQLTATGTYANSNTYDITGSVTWSSLDTAVANVDATGMATAVEFGTTTINATSGSIAGNTPLRVVGLPKSGQNTCYDSAGNVVDCAGTGQDGDVQAGVTWPSTRFTVGSGGEADCVTDNLTGLMWVRAPGDTAWAWADALTYANGLVLCGYDDWRLPNRRELIYLVNRGQPHTASWLNTLGFINVATINRWASTTLGDADHLDLAYAPDLSAGGIGTYVKSNLMPHTWPVRSTATPRPVVLPQTGQTACYDAAGVTIPCSGTGQDGDTRAGDAWPDPRFTVGSGATAACVTDNATGLMWVKSPDSTARTWQQALDHANGLTLCNYSDWRLPNLIELESLHRAAPSNRDDWFNSQGFGEVAGGYYWSSTTKTATPAQAWAVIVWDVGYIFSYDKVSTAPYTWPVRGP